MPVLFCVLFLMINLSMAQVPSSNGLKSYTEYLALKNLLGAEKATAKCEISINGKKCDEIGFQDLVKTNNSDRLFELIDQFPLKDLQNIESVSIKGSSVKSIDHFNDYTYLIQLLEPMRNFDHFPNQSDCEARRINKIIFHADKAFSDLQNLYHIQKVFPDANLTYDRIDQNLEELITTTQQIEIMSPTVCAQDEEMNLSSLDDLIEVYENFISSTIAYVSSCKLEHKMKEMSELLNSNSQIEFKVIKQWLFS
jgi:hypothetical protein